MTTKTSAGTRNAEAEPTWSAIIAQLSPERNAPTGALASSRHAASGGLLQLSVVVDLGQEDLDDVRIELGA